MKIRELAPFIPWIVSAFHAPLGLADGLAQVGLKVGMTYSAGKSALLKGGWKLLEVKPLDGSKPFKQFPEISCGSGRDAICSVGFQNERNYLAIIVEMRGNKLVIVGEY